MRSAEAEAVFGSFHPAIPLAFFACAVGFGALVMTPAFQVVGIGSAALLWAVLKGRGSLRLLLGLAVAFCVLTAANPLFNTEGATVLLWAFGRPYTLEALAFGAATSAMLIEVILWFACLDAVVASDELARLVGGVAPSLGLVLAQMQRLVPSYGRRLAETARLRAAMTGEGPHASLDARVATAGRALASLIGWAFEDAMVRADSLRSRGYGIGRPTRYARHRWGRGDSVALAGMVALAIVIAIALLQGAAAVEWFPMLVLPTPSLWAIIGLAAYGALLLAPSVLAVGRRALWRRSLSRA